MALLPSAGRNHKNALITDPHKASATNSISLVTEILLP